MKMKTKERKNNSFLTRGVYFLEILTTYFLCSLLDLAGKEIL